MKKLIPIFEIGPGELVGDFEMLNDEKRYFSIQCISLDGSIYEI
jgi:hypothetical protein